MEKFIKRQQQLNKAIKKVQSKLETMAQIAKTEFHDKFDSLSEVERDFWRAEFDRWNWNKWHDLEYRLTDRLKENHSKYCSWHYDQKGWVAF